MKKYNAVQLIKFLLIFLLFSKIALAGGWSSGGGELLKDSVNPWFLNNTPNVNYCILIDQENFGASQEVARHQLTRAIQFWQEEFTYAVLPKLSNFGQLQIASQTFTETTCSNNTDIVFQFGVLNHLQRKFLKDPTKYAAISVRTDYDEVHLKGKGFIYISPSAGPLAYDSEGVIKDAWSINDGHLLYLTLLHELGHIFGLQHMGSYGDLMSEGFIEATLAHMAYSNIPLTEDVHFFSLMKSSRLICPDELLIDSWQKFFGAQITDKCFQFVFTHNPANELFGKTLMGVYVAASPLDTLKQIHEIELAMDRFFPLFTSLIWLSQRQTVFDKCDLQLGINSGILGGSGITIGKQGQFFLPNRKIHRSISVRFEQGRSTFFIDGVIDGKIIPLL